jgi:hypothetical protein
MTIYQLVVKGNYDDIVQLRNVHHYEFPDYVPTTAQLQALVDSFDTDLKTRIQTYFSNKVDIDAYDIRRVDLGNLAAVEYQATAGSWTGGASGEPLPTQIAGLVTFKAPTVFPRAARSYMFPFTEAHNSSAGIMATVLETALLGWGGDILSHVIPGAANAVKVAVEYGGDPRAVTDSNVLESVSVTNVWATQRRRRRGVGI